MALIAAEKHQGLFLSAAEWAIVTDILQKHLPGRRVWAFGSRATGARLKPYSDLDLAVDGSLSPAEESRLATAFDNSVLPFRLDVVEVDALQDAFLRQIEHDFVRVQ